MVSNARLDLPDPESPVMQIRRFRGRRTVMSLRLCSRAPWTTSSSAAILRTFYRANRRSVDRLQRRCKAKTGGMGDTARKAFVATTVAVAVIAAALALWHLRLLVALL